MLLKLEEGEHFIKIHFHVIRFCLKNFLVICFINIYLFQFWYFSKHFHKTASLFFFLRRESDLPLSEICSVMSNSLWPHGIYSSWNSTGENTGVGSLSLLQWIAWPRNKAEVSCIADRFFTNWAIRETLICHSDQISHSVVSDSLRPHESQHARSPCPSPTPRVHPDSRPSSQAINVDPSLQAINAGEGVEKRELS